MKIIIDERETNIHEKCCAMMNDISNKITNTISIEKRVLPIGDFLLQSDDGKTLCILERKSLASSIPLSNKVFRTSIL